MTKRRGAKSEFRLPDFYQAQANILRCTRSPPIHTQTGAPEANGDADVRAGVAAYREEHRAIRDMGCPLGEHFCIVDLTSCPLQVFDVAKAFQSEIGSAAKARRLATYTGNALARMQARRIARERDDVAIFELREEAEAWLFADGNRQAA